MKFPRTLLWNVYSGAIAAVTTVVAHKVVVGIWRASTGRRDTPDPNDPHVPAPEALLWALASGIGIGLSQLVVNRFAALQWERFTGEDAPSTQKVTVQL